MGSYQCLLVDHSCCSSLRSRYLFYTWYPACRWKTYTTLAGNVKNVVSEYKCKTFIIFPDIMEKLTGVTTSMMLCTTYEYHLPGARTPGMYQVPGTAVRTKYSYLPYICMMRVPRCHDCYYHGVQQRNALVLCRLFLCLLYGYVYTRTYMNNKTTAVVYSHLIVFFLVSRVIP